MPRHVLTNAERRKGGKNSALTERIDHKIKAFLKVKPKGGDDRDTKYIKELHRLAEHKDPKIRLLAIKELWDRGYGKPKQSIEHSGDTENPIMIMTPEERAIAEGVKKAKK
jgi:hypothetical protein